MARLLLQLITTEATSPLNQSEFLSNAWNLLKARAKSRAQVAIGFGFGFGFAFASHWLKNGREIFKPTTIRHCYLKATLSTSLHLPWSWMLKYSYSSSGDPKYFLTISGNINFYNHQDWLNWPQLYPTRDLESPWTYMCSIYWVNTTQI